MLRYQPLIAISLAFFLPAKGAPAASAPLSLPVGPSLSYSVGAFAIPLSATGGVPPYHYSLTPGSSAPPGSRVQDGQPLPTDFGSATGGLIGVFVTPGTYATSLRVTDSTETTADQAITVTVSQLQILTQTNLLNGTINTAYQQNISFTGYGGVDYAWTATGLPTGMSVSNNGLGTLSGTPTEAGTFTPVVTLTDRLNGATVSKTFLMVVYPFAINPGPELPVGTLHGGYSKTLSAPACGAGCTWSLVSGSLPTGMNFSAAGVLSGTPGSTYYNGFTVQASGPNGVVQREFGLVVPNMSQALTINMATPLAETTYGTPYALMLNVTGGTPPYIWEVVDIADTPVDTIVTGPGELLASDLTPEIFYLWGMPVQLGAFNFTLQVSDNVGHTASKAMSWTITPLNFNYTALPLPGTSLLDGTAYSQPLLVLGGSGNYPTWSVAAGSSLPPALSLDASTGVISGTPTSTGAFNTAIQVTDSVGNTMTQDIAFTVGVPVPTPVLAIGSSHVGNFSEGDPAAIYTISVSNTGTASTNATVTVTETVPNGLTLVSMSGTGWICTPNSNSCTTNGVLAAGASYGGISATVAVGVFTGSVTNNVGVSGGGSASSGGSDPTTITPYSACDVNHQGLVNAADLQQMINEALGGAAPNNDLNADGAVNVVDVEIAIDAALNYGCKAS